MCATPYWRIVDDPTQRQRQRYVEIVSSVMPRSRKTSTGRNGNRLGCPGVAKHSSSSVLRCHAIRRWRLDLPTRSVSAQSLSALLLRRLRKRCAPFVIRLVGELDFNKTLCSPACLHSLNVVSGFSARYSASGGTSGMDGTRNSLRG
jgi:hypothetical protein